MYSSYSQVIQVVKSFKHLFIHMQVPLYYTLPFSQVVMYSAYCRDTSVNNIISHMLVYVQNKILEVELLFPRVYSFVILINTISLSSLQTVPICITTSNECRKVPFFAMCSHKHNVIELLADLMGVGKRFPIVVLIHFSHSE